MVSAIPPFGSTPQPQGSIPPNDLKQMRQWQHELGDNPPPDSLAGKIHELLQTYISGEKPWVSLNAVKDDINSSFIAGDGHLDVYAANADEPPGVTIEDLQNTISLFGITPPPITSIDGQIFMVKSRFPADSKNDLALKDLLLSEFKTMGSYADPSKLKPWGQEEMHSPTYLSASPDAQMYFRRMCGIYT